MAVQAFISGSGTTQEVAERYGVAVRTLTYWVTRFRREGTSEPLPRAGGNVSLVKGELLDEVVASQPDWTTYELARAYNRRVKRGERVSRSAIVRALARFGYVFKKNGTDLRSRIDRM